MSYAIDDLLAEQTLRAEQQEHQGQHIGKPDFDATAHERAQVHLGELLAHTDDQAADDGAGHRGQAAQNHHRQGAQRHGGQRELHTQLGAPDHPGHQGHDTRHTPDDDPDAVERNADGLRRLVVVGHGAQGAAGLGLLEEDAQYHHQRGRNAGGDHVFLVHQHTALEHRFEQEHGLLGHADVDLVDVAAKKRLAQAFKKVGDAQRRHEQRGAFLVDQVAQYQALNEPGHCKHADARDHEGQQVGNDHVVDAGPLGNPLGKPGHGQRCEQHHGALGEVENARGLVDQHEAEGHQRIEHAGHEAANQCFKKECHLFVPFKVGRRRAAPRRPRPPRGAAQYTK